MTVQFIGSTPPPPKGNGGRPILSRYEALTQTLSEQAGQWFMVSVEDIPRGHREVHSKRLQDASRRWGFEVEVRRGDGVSRTYARWPKDKGLPSLKTIHPDALDQVEGGWPHFKPVEELPEQQEGLYTSNSRIVEELQAHPGQWAVVSLEELRPGVEVSRTSSHTLRSRLVRLGVEARLRSSREDKTITLYARWPEQ